MENEVLKAIKERRSIRRFKADQITDEELKTVLEAGTWAATGHGTQEPFIIAVQNPEICAQLRKMNAEIMGVESDPYYGAPTIVIVLAPESNVNGVKDGSLILGNMMLAAHSIGLTTRMPTLNRKISSTYSISIPVRRSMPSVMQSAVSQAGCSRKSKSRSKSTIEASR